MIRPRQSLLNAVRCVTFSMAILMASFMAIASLPGFTAFTQGEISDVWSNAWGPASAHAQVKTHTQVQVQFAHSDITVLPVFIDDEEVTEGLLPRLEEDRLFGPVRNISEHLGAQVDYDPSTRKVTLTRPEIKVELTVGSEEATVHRTEAETPETVEFDAPMFIDEEVDEAGGRAYAPLRFIAEQFGYEVTYHHDTRTVDLISASKAEAEQGEQKEQEEKEEETATEEEAEIDPVEIRDLAEVAEGLGTFELAVDKAEEALEFFVEFHDNEEIPAYQVDFDPDEKDIQITLDAVMEEEETMDFEDPLLNEVSTRFIIEGDESMLREIEQRTASENTENNTDNEDDGDDKDNEENDEKNDLEKLLDKAREETFEIVGSKIEINLNYTVPDLEKEEKEDQLDLYISRLFKEKISETELAEGLTHKAFKKGTADGPMSINELWFDPNGAIEPALTVPNNEIPGLARLDAMAEQENAIAAVNGGFYYDRYPVGMIFRNNQLVWKPLDNRSALFYTDEGETMIARTHFGGGDLVLLDDGNDQDHNRLPIDRLNRTRREGEAVVYTQERGFDTGTSDNEDKNHKEIVVYDGEVVNINSGNSLIPQGGFVLSMDENYLKKWGDFVNRIEEGDNVKLDWDLGPEVTEEDIAFALNGGPRLIENGQVDIQSVEENIAANIRTGRHPRTAVGVSGEGKMIVTTVDGRRSRYASIGMTLEELGEYKHERGAVDALNLDGGGSTMMWFDDDYQNVPAGSPRQINNALIFK